MVRISGAIRPVRLNIGGCYKTLHMMERRLSALPLAGKPYIPRTAPLSDIYDRYSGAIHLAVPMDSIYNDAIVSYRLE